MCSQFKEPIKYLLVLTALFFLLNSLLFVMKCTENVLALLLIKKKGFEWSQLSCLKLEKQISKIKQTLLDRT